MVFYFNPSQSWRAKMMSAVSPSRASEIRNEVNLKIRSFVRTIYSRALNLRHL